MAKKENFKELTAQELQDRLSTEKENLVRLKMTHSISPIDNPLQIKVARRNIARLETLIRQREINK